MKNTLFIPMLLILLVLDSATSLACKEGPVDYDFEYWLKLNDKELQRTRTHCVHEQIKFRMFLYKGDTENVIKSGKKLRKEHVLDKIDLKSEASALYTAKRYDEALGVFLLSQDSDPLEECSLFMHLCRNWKDESIADHYLLYKYYRAANRNIAADIALKRANIEYEKVYINQPDLQKIFQWLSIEEPVP